MSGSTIGGPLDYAKLAQLHRPIDPATLRAAATELRGRGLTARDIGDALGLAEAVVVRLLGEAPR